MKYTDLKKTRCDLKESIPLKKPFTVLIEPANFCNFKCIQCFQSVKSSSYIKENQGNMSYELFDQIISSLEQWKGEKIKVLKLNIYGEPFVNPHFCQMLKRAKDSNVFERIETTSNISLMNDEIIEKLVEYEIDFIRASIYGVDSAHYAEVTGNLGDNFNKVKENLAKIKAEKKKQGKKKPFVGAKILDCYDERNDRFLKEFSDIADELYIEKPHNWIEHEEKSFVGSYYTQEQLEKMNTELKELSSPKIACPMPFTTLAVRCNGDVSPCCIDWLGHTNISNVKEQSLPEIWNGLALFDFRKMQLENRRCENQSCGKCEILHNDYYTMDNIDGFPVEKLEKAMKIEKEGRK